MTKNGAPSATRGKKQHLFFYMLVCACKVNSIQICRGFGELCRIAHSPHQIFSFTNVEATVACKQMQYRGGGEAFNAGNKTMHETAILGTNINCDHDHAKHPTLRSCPGNWSQQKPSCRTYIPPTCRYIIIACYKLLPSRD